MERPNVSLSKGGHFSVSLLTMLFAEYRFDGSTIQLCFIWCCVTHQIGPVAVPDRTSGQEHSWVNGQCGCQWVRVTFFNGVVSPANAVVSAGRLEEVAAWSDFSLSFF